MTQSKPPMQNIKGLWSGFGKVEGFSFHASKLLNGFEGGYITTNDAELAAELRCVRHFGFNGNNKIVREGLNAALNALHAAMALASIDILPAHISQNRARHHAWQEALSGLPSLCLMPYSDTEVRGFKNVLVRCEDDWPLAHDTTLIVFFRAKICSFDHSIILRCIIRPGNSQRYANAKWEPPIGLPGSICCYLPENLSAETTLHSWVRF